MARKVLTGPNMRSRTRTVAFDTAAKVPHRRYVVTLVRRLAAMAAVLTLCVGNLAECAGWQPTPEARMECCANGTKCPMHKSESDRKSTRLNSSHLGISYAVFCLKKKK